MSNWTPAARNELERYFARLGPWLKGTGADPAEVIDDLRQHLEREVRAEGLGAVTEADVRRLLGKVGAPEPEAPTQPPPTTPVNPSELSGTLPGAGAGGSRPGYGLLVFGVGLPLATLLIEWLTRMCAAAFFDPLPGLGQVALVAWVPLANWWVWRSVREGRRDRIRALDWANGVAIGVSIFYAILFLPLLLPGLFAMIFFGWGLLPWSPMLAMVCAFMLRRHLRRLVETGGGGRLTAGWKGTGLAWLLLLLLAAPSWSTRVGLSMAASPEETTRQRGLAWLRTVGNEDTLLRACYGRTRNAASMDLVTLLLANGRDVPPETAREIYYRVTGRPFNAVPPPDVRTARGAFAELNEWTWDPDQAGEAVGGRLRGLQLRASRLDAVADANAGWSYTEWVLEFRNDSRRQQEARAQVLLPPGGVVSRLTLWVNGEEQEAAFAGRAQTRQAYEAIVRQRRDPVLVTTTGPDRVLVQCFPVPPDGGLMKVRLGITAPLLLSSGTEAVFLWPHFLERNFSIPAPVRHVVWFESQGSRRLVSERLQIESLKPEVQAARGELTEEELGSAVRQIRLERDPNRRFAWSRDERTLGKDVVVQHLVTTNRPPVRSVVLALDTSVGMGPYAGEIAAVLREVRETLEVAVVLAGDQPAWLEAERAAGNPLPKEELAARLERLRAAGGQDNLPALEQAWDRAAGLPDSVVVWVHAAQPVALGSAESLRQRYDRRPKGPRIFALQGDAGPNRLLEQLDGLPGIEAVPRLGSVAEDLQGLIARLHDGIEGLQSVRERRPAGSDDVATLAEAERTAAHLARLWAKQEIGRLQAGRQQAAAVEMAGLFQLVTPISGAVVLETAAQYQAAGLTPVDAQTVPAIPEPKTASLFLLGGLMLWWLERRRRGPRRRS